MKQTPGAYLSRMYSLRRMLNENVMKIFLSSFVMTIIDYGLIIWGVQSAFGIDILQRKLIASFFLSTTKIFKKQRSKSVIK